MTLPPSLHGAFAVLADVARAGGRRFVLVALLSVATAAVEGVALVALPPLIRAFDPAGAAQATPRPVSDITALLGLPGTLAAYVGLVALAALMVGLGAIASQRLVIDHGEALRDRLHRAVMGVAWGAPPVARSADLTHALTNEVGQCAFAVQIALGGLTRALQMPPLLLAALALSPGFTAVVTIAGALASLPLIPLARRADRSAGAMAEAARDLNHEVSDQMAGRRILKILGAEGLRYAALRRRIDQFRRAQSAQTATIVTAQGLRRVAVAAAAAAGGWYGLTVLHLDGAALLALVLVFGRLMAGAGRLQEDWRRLTRLLPVYGAVAGRIEACLAAAEPAPAAVAPRLTRALRLEAVGYTHPGETRPTLHDITLDLTAATTIALVGPSGAGKSTLADLLMGLTAPSAGTIRVDDTVLDGPERIAWRARVAHVPQDPFLFHDTLRANLALARPQATEAEMRAALSRAAADFVFALPQGLETVVGDRGARLSGGERQRIVLARALLQQPDLLVLDEATSALDAETEAEVLRTLRALGGKTTVLIIAHRASTLASADRVVRLEAGCLVEASSDALDGPEPRA